MSATFLDFQAINLMPQRAMGAAITRVRVQIFDVNYEQIIKLFCMKYTPVIFYKSSQWAVRDWHHRFEHERG